MWRPAKSTLWADENNPTGAIKLLYHLEIPFNRDFCSPVEWIFRSSNDTMNNQYSKVHGSDGKPVPVPHTLHLRQNHAGFFLLLFQFRFQNIDSRFCVFTSSENLVHFQKTGRYQSDDTLSDTVPAWLLRRRSTSLFNRFSSSRFACSRCWIGHPVLEGYFFRVKIICHTPGYVPAQHSPMRSYLYRSCLPHTSGARWCIRQRTMAC